MKTYLCFLACIAILSFTHAQHNELIHVGQLEEMHPLAQPIKPTAQATPKAVIWNETFDIGTSSPTTTLGPTFTTSNGVWTTGGANGDVWKHNFFTTSGEWSIGTPAMASTSEADGKMLFDADSINFPLSPNYIELYGELISPPIDLTTNTSAVLSWEQNSRLCCGGTLDLEISISSDNGVTWGPIIDADDEHPQGDDFYSHNNFSYLSSVNISGEAAGNIVLIKFTWNGIGSGNTHYYWELDDVSISTLPDNDLQIVKSWFVGENNGGIQYGRTPSSQFDDNYYVGSEVYNAGAINQTNLNLSANCNMFNNDIPYVQLNADSTATIEELMPFTPNWATDTINYVINSDHDTLGSTTYLDNIDSLYFEVTDYLYGIDVIGLHPTPQLNSIGTSSFTGGEDGLVLANLYRIKSFTEVGELLVNLGPNTIEGAEVYGSIKNEASVLAHDMTSIYNTDPVVVTAADITNGYIVLYFPSCAELNAGSYYASVELYSQGNTFDISIVDDLTYSQPDYASVIYIPGDLTYINGNAFAIRMVTDCIGLHENQLSGISIFPNPSDGVVTITNDDLMENNITVTDLTGKIILTKETSKELIIDLTSEESGVYIIEVSNAHGRQTERVVIQ